MRRHPAGRAHHFLTALLFALVPGYEVLVAADRDYEQLREELKPLEETFAPQTVFLYRLPGEEYTRLEKIVPFVRDMVPREGEMTFYICRDFACRQPTTKLAEVREILRS